MIPTRCLTLRYPWCILCIMGSNAPLSGMMAQYLAKLLISRNRKSVVRATSMLRRISCKKSRALTLTPD